MSLSFEECLSLRAGILWDQLVGEADEVGAGREEGREVVRARQGYAPHEQIVVKFTK